MKKTVLLVEDHDINRKLFRDILVREGYEVIETTDGDEACILATTQPIDLVVMDVRLNGSKINGLEAIKILRADARTANMPILTLTAYAREEDKHALMEAGTSIYLFKPFKVAEFIEIVHTLTGTVR